MRGILEAVLVSRYGEPEVGTEGRFIAKRWATASRASSVLYCCTDWHSPPAADVADLRSVYGEYCGGSLAGGAIKIAMLSDEQVFGLFGIRELVGQPEVQRAREIDPTISFFMDASNVWFYGHRNGALFVFDSETDELDELGPVSAELERLIEDWESAHV